MSNPTPSGTPARSGGLSLYANLLDPSGSTGNTSASISREPVVFSRASNETTQSEDAAAKKQQIDAATLRFQPTKRPQLASQKAKKQKFPKPTDVKNTPAKELPKAAAPQAAARPVKSTLADWTGIEDDDVNGFYGGGERRQRGGRKKRKKNREEYEVVQDWDDIYDPSRPNNYEEYKNSDEKLREMREWKDRLYAHRIARKYSSDQDSDEDGSRRPVNNQFAPPPNLSFAPPPSLIPATAEKSTPDSDSVPPPPPPPVTSVKEQSPAQTPPETLPAGAISRAPVRYNFPAAPAEIPRSEAELEKALEDEETANVSQDEDDAEARSRLPGQKGFAERLMNKYGWSKGTGLGADNSGILNPLQVKVEKRKKKSDAEGGGFRDAGGRGKIIGGQRAKKDEEEDMGGRFGVMSDVVVLRGMVDGMDLDEEVEGSGDGGLMQEIGDECAEKYGRVERVYIHRHGTAPAKVFVKFTSQLSALRAVNALEGRIFNGNTITALFHDSEKFEQGIYE